jgi:hypothetical protein
MYFGPTDSTLRISLDHVEPEVWRRVVVPSAIGLPDLAGVFEVAMGWDGSHLHQFVVAGISFAPPDDDNEWTIDYRKITLQQVARFPGSVLSWHYDFGDGWTHTVLVETSGRPDPAVVGPVVLDGAMACPPEDCGGPFGYAQMLEAAADPRHEEHDDVLDWLGDDFDPAVFDPGAVNARLRPFRQRATKRR